MATKSLPTPEYLRQRLRYEPDTGKLYWRDNGAMPANWRARYAGKEAFTAHLVRGYRQGRVAGRHLLAHRVCWAVYHGEWPNGHIDHIDHDTTNNKIANLRDVDRSGNQRNQSAPNASKSGVLGVCWNEARKRWVAQITVGTRHVNLGRFADLDEAVAARKAAEHKFGFHANHGT